MDKILFWIYIAANIFAAFIVVWKQVLRPLLPKLWFIFEKASLRAACQNKDSKKLSLRQGLLLGITLVISTSDVFLPKFVAVDAGMDAWLSVIFATIIILILLALLLPLLKAFPEENLPTIMKNYFSPVTATPLFLIWFFFLLLLSAVVVRELTEVVKQGFLTETPAAFLAASILLVAGYTVRKGLQIIARTNDFLLIIGLGTLFFVIFMLVGEADFKEYLPILEHGFGRVIKGSLVVLVYTSDVLLLLSIIYPYLQKKERVGLGFMGVIMFLFLALEGGTLAIGIFGVKPTQALLLPALEMVRYVHITTFIERLEGLLIPVWVGGIFVKIAFFYYALTETLQIWVGLKRGSFLTWPLAFIIFGLTFQPFPGLTEFLDFMSNTSFYMYVFLLMMIFLILIIALMKKRLSMSSKQEGVKQQELQP